MFGVGSGLFIFLFEDTIHNKIKLLSYDLYGDEYLLCVEPNDNLSKVQSGIRFMEEWYHQMVNALRNNVCVIRK